MPELVNQKKVFTYSVKNGVIHNQHIMFASSNNSSTVILKIRIWGLEIYLFFGTWNLEFQLLKSYF